jgi:hypothetical protein
VHAAQAEEEDEPTLFIASATIIEPITVQVHSDLVHLDESKLLSSWGRMMAVIVLA